MDFEEFQQQQKKQKILIRLLPKTECTTDGVRGNNFIILFKILKGVFPLPDRSPNNTK